MNTLLAVLGDYTPDPSSRYITVASRPQGTLLCIIVFTLAIQMLQFYSNNERKVTSFDGRIFYFSFTERCQRISTLLDLQQIILKKLFPFEYVASQLPRTDFSS